MDVTTVKMQVSFVWVKDEYHATSEYIMLTKLGKQVPAAVEMVMSGWSQLKERMREKDEWRYVTVEYGGQCVTMAGMKWMLMWSANNWDMDNLV